MKITKKNSPLKSYQNLILLQNLYRLKSIGFNYISSFTINEKKDYHKPLSLGKLVEDIKQCHLCDLSKSRIQSMYGYGDKNATIMIIDFSVSESQDRNNEYYSGRSGEMLQHMIQNSLSKNIEDIYYTHTIKCKPLNSNIPSSSEWNSCKNYLFSQIEFIQPKVIITLGEDVYRNITSDKEIFEKIRGHIIDFQTYKLIPIYHPKHLLRNPELQKTTLNDLKKIKSYL